MLHKVTIEILLDIADEGEASDAISETMRPMLRNFAGAESCVIDWRYAPNGDAVPDTGEGFEYTPDDGKEVKAS